MQLVSMRRQWLAASRADVPAVLWIVALVGSVLTVAYASAFVSSRYALLMISGTSLTIGLLFLFLLSVDYPFRNRNGVTSQPFEDLSGIFDKIDRSRSALHPRRLVACDVGPCTVLGAEQNSVKDAPKRAAD